MSYCFALFIFQEPQYRRGFSAISLTIDPITGLNTPANPYISDIDSIQRAF